MFISIPNPELGRGGGARALAACRYKGPGMIKTGFGRHTQASMDAGGQGGECEYRFMWVGCSCRRRVPYPDR